MQQIHHTANIRYNNVRTRPTSEMNVRNNKIKSLNVPF